MTRALTAVAVLVWLVAGTWLLGAIVAPGPRSAVVAVVAWFLLTGLLTTRLARRRPELRLALRGTYLATMVLALGAGVWTTQRETSVDEQVVVGAPAGDAPVDDLLAPQQ